VSKDKAPSDKSKKSVVPRAEQESGASTPPGPGLGSLFPVVGIGASAGGLEAFTELLRHLPAGSGMALVLVQHLDRTHASFLKAFMFGVRTAVRTTLVPTASNRRANRAPSLASRSTTSTSGWMSSVVLRACCAHQSSDGARVTAACMILRLVRSRKNRTKIGRKSTSKVCTKSQAQVTWLRRKVVQRWPSPGTRFFMYRCTVRFETRMPSLSNSPRSRSAPHLGFRSAIARISVA